MGFFGSEKKKKKFYYGKGNYPRWRDSGKLVHRTVAENIVGGRISQGREVHHKDGNVKNFRRSNLQVMSASNHKKLHTKKRRSFW